MCVCVLLSLENHQLRRHQKQQHPKAPLQLPSPASSRSLLWEPERPSDFPPLFMPEAAPPPLHEAWDRLPQLKVVCLEDKEAGDPSPHRGPGHRQALYIPCESRSF